MGPNSYDSSRPYAQTTETEEMFSPIDAEAEASYSRKEIYDIPRIIGNTPLE